MFVAPVGVATEPGSRLGLHPRQPALLLTFHQSVAPLNIEHGQTATVGRSGRYGGPRWDRRGAAVAQWRGSVVVTALKSPTLTTPRLSRPLIACVIFLNGP